MGHEHEQPQVAADWERMYAEGPRRWSGAVNATLASIVAGMAPGRVLDLGAGEGGDAVWFAERGWQVVAADWSATALGRVRELARQAGVGDRVEAWEADLTREDPEGDFDLISAAFFMWGDDAARNAALHRLAARVRAGGALLIIDHGSVPPWSQHHHDTEFATPQETYAALELGAGWSAERLEAVERAVRDADGNPATILDHVVVARRAL